LRSWLEWNGDYTSIHQTDAPCAEVKEEKENGKAFFVTNSGIPRVVGLERDVDKWPCTVCQRNVEDATRRLTGRTIEDGRRTIDRAGRNVGCCCYTLCCCYCVFQVLKSNTTFFFLLSQLKSNN
jgi:hypothetical protein